MEVNKIGSNGSPRPQVHGELICKLVTSLMLSSALQGLESTNMFPVVSNSNTSSVIPTKLFLAHPSDIKLSSTSSHIRQHNSSTAVPIPHL
jgi:hypothetical protein